MAYYVTTALGRMVPQGDVGTVRQDLVLKVLYDYSRSPFNPNNEAISPTRISRAAHLSEPDVQDVAESLVALRLVERVPPENREAYRISGQGAVMVMNLSQNVSNAL